MLRVKEKFDALVRTFAGSETFKGLAGTAIKLATAFLKFAESLERVLPQLTTLAALKIGRNIAPGLLMLAGGRGRGRSGGGVVSKFAQGGMVPGSGNRDTVPAMLTPGEFVIRKTSVKKMGADKLAQMNNNRYAKGGKLSAAKFNRVVDGDSLNIAATPEGKPYNTSTRLIGYDAYELNSGTKRERELGKKAKKMAQRRYGSRKSVFNLFKGHSMDKYGRPMYKDDEFGEMMLRTRPPVATRYGGTGARATKKKKALGGLIQRFALGGIANVSRVGAAILQEDQGLKNEQFGVGVKDVQKAVGGGSGSVGNKLRKGVGSQFKGKKYTLVAQGLGKTTSEGFREALIDGVATGLDAATGSLGADLGLGQARLDSGSRTEFKSYIGKRPIVGDLFEAALSSLSGKGKFAESQVSAPFDFPGGLSGAVKDNYNKLPSSWIDAKSSSVNATAAAFKTKVTNELADEYKRTAAPTKKAAKGGSIAGSDTVPAMLTPGEFVFSKSSSQKIGYSALNRMNKQGVSGYAAGGVVSHGRHAYGAATGPFSGSSGTSDPKHQTLKSILAASRKASQTLTTIAGSNNSIKNLIKSLHTHLKSVHDTIRGNTKPKDATKDTSDEIVALGGELDSMARIICECIHELKGKDLSGGGGGDGGDSDDTTTTSTGSRRGRAGGVIRGVGAAVALPFAAVSKGLETMAGGLQRVSSGLIALSFISGTVIQQMGSISDAQKAQIQAGLNSVSVFAAIGAEVFAFGLGIAAALAAMVAHTAVVVAHTIAKAPEIVATIASTAATVGKAAADASAAVMVAIFGAEVAVATGAIIPLAVAGALAAAALVALAGSVAGPIASFMSSFVAGTSEFTSGIVHLGFMAFQSAVEMEKLKQNVEKFNSAADKIIEDVASGRGGSREDFIRLTREAAMGQFQGSAMGARQFGFGEDWKGSLFERAFTGGQQRQAVAPAGVTGMTAMGTDAVINHLADKFDAIPARFMSVFPGVWDAVRSGATSLARGLSGVAKTVTVEGAKIAGRLNLEGLKQVISDTAAIIDGFKKEIDPFTQKVGALAGGFAAITYDSTQSLYSFNEALKKAETEGLDALSRTEIRAGGTTSRIQTFRTRKDQLGQLSRRRRTLDETLQKEGLLVGDVRTETDAKGFEKEIALSKVLRKEENDARAALNKELESILAQEAHIRQGILEATGERLQKLVKSGDIAAFGGIKDLAKVGTAAAEFAIRLEKLRKDLDESIMFRFDQRIEQEAGRGKKHQSSYCR